MPTGHLQCRKKKKGLNLLKHVLFSCTSKVDAFNPAGKHIASQLQLNVSQSKMIFNSNRSFGAEPIKPFCWFHITKWFSIVNENLSKLFYLNRLSSKTPKSKFLGLRRADNSMWFKRVCVQLWISPPKHFLCSGDKKKSRRLSMATMILRPCVVPDLYISHHMSYG